MKLGAFLQTYKNDGRTDFALNHFRKYFPDSPFYLVSDMGDDFKDLSIKYKTYYEHSTIHIGSGCGGYNLNQMKEWLNRLYRGFSFCRTDFILYMEDDILVRHGDLIYDNITIAGVLENPINNNVVEYFERKYGKKFNTNLYGACGGTIYETETFLNNYQNFLNIIDDSWNDIIKMGYRIDYLDMLTPILYMTMGYNYTKNINLIEDHRGDNWRDSKCSLLHGKTSYKEKI
jgi:hypothetical protein